MNRVFPVILIFLISMIVLPTVSQEQANSFPFTEAQNQDGSKFVWFVYAKAGFDYEYFQTSELPESVYFKKVKQPQSGDIAYWSKYMAVVSVQQGKPISILVAGNEHSFEELSKLYGAPSYFRYLKGLNKP